PCSHNTYSSATGCSQPRRSIRPSIGEAMRAFAVVVLTIGVVSVLGLRAAESTAAKPGCNGLIAFASNRAQDAQAEIYAIAPDGSRTDVSRSIGADGNPQ